MDFYLQRTVGVDIREEGVVVTFLGKGIKGLTCFDREIIPGRLLDPPAEGEVLNSVQKELREFFQRNWNQRDEVVVGIPRSQVFFKTLQIPAPERSKVPDILRFEIDRHLPVAAEETVFDCEISDAPVGNLFTVHLNAIRKSVLGRYLDRLSAVGIVPSALDISTTANRNVLRLSEPKSGRKEKGEKPPYEIFVDISPTRLEVDLFQGNLIVYCRSSVLDGENAFAAEGTPPSTFLAGQILEEIQRVQMAIGEIRVEEKVSRVILSGGGTLLPTIRETVEFLTGIKTELLDLSGIKVQGREKLGPEQGVGTSLGLALKLLETKFKGPNLLPEEKRIKRTHLSPYVFLALGSLGLVLLVAYGITSYVKARSEFREVKEALEKMGPQVKQVEAITGDIEIKSGFLKELSDISRKHSNVVPILDELTRLIPGDAYLTEIEITEDQIDIRGLAQNASALIAPLELSPLFMDVRFDGTIRKSEGRDAFRINMKHQT